MKQPPSLIFRTPFETIVNDIEGSVMGTDTSSVAVPDGDPISSKGGRTTPEPAVTV